jgi:hypothetical protein
MSNRSPGSPDGTVSDLSARRIERRTFVRGLGATVAAGLGLAVLPGKAVAVGSRRPGSGPGQGMHPDSCGVFCSLVECGSQTCLGASLYHCVNQCDGSSYDTCSDSHGCSNYCLAPC